MNAALLRIGHDVAWSHSRNGNCSWSGSQYWSRSQSRSGTTLMD